MSLRREDLFLIMKWRNSQKEVLRQDNILTKKIQLRYYQNFILPSYNSINPKIILFSYLLDNKCIGYGGLTNINWYAKRAEVSFLLNPKNAKNSKLYATEFDIFLKLLKYVSFKELKLNRLFTETYDIRPIHIKTLLKNGFKYEGRMKQHILIKNNYFDSLIHGILKKDYKDRKKIYAEQ